MSDTKPSNGSDLLQAALREGQRNRYQKWLKSRVQQLREMAGNLRDADTATAHALLSRTGKALES